MRERYLHRCADENPLVYYLYWIALVQHAFYQDRTVNAGHALMSLRYVLQYRWSLFAGVGIERDHHAARIALQNRYDHLRSNSQGSTDKLILGEALSRC